MGLLLLNNVFVVNFRTLKFKPPKKLLKSRDITFQTLSFFDIMFTLQTRKITKIDNSGAQM